jgi:hypothetical protein
MLVQQRTTALLSVIGMGRIRASRAKMRMGGT